VAVQTSNHPIETPSAPRTLVLTRVFDAPRALVWEAWTNPRRLAQWWGPHDYTAPRLTDEDGGVFVEILNTVTLADRNGRTPLRLEARVLQAAPGAAGPLAGMEEGWSQSLDMLASDVATRASEREMGARTRITMRATFHSADARELVFRQFGAYEGAHQTLNRLARFLGTV